METVEGRLVIPPTEDVELFVRLLNEFAENHYLLTEGIKQRLQEYRELKRLDRTY